jgi:hypothetical protein
MTDNHFTNLRPNGRKSVNCQVHGCNHAAIAKGLCRKHYMRQRRTGDPNKRRWAGRPREARQSMLELFRSERTARRYTAAMEALRAVGATIGGGKVDGTDYALRFMEAACHSYGNCNASRLERLAIQALSACVDGVEDGPHFVRDYLIDAARELNYQRELQHLREQRAAILAKRGAP